MRSICISDTHNYHSLLNMPEPQPNDILIHAGDATMRGTFQEVNKFLRWFGGQPYDHKVMIAGNHDFGWDRDNETMRSLIPDGVTYLENSGTVINGLQIWGSPMVPDLPGWAFARNRGNAIRRYWEMIPPETDILITHSPPESILDNPAFHFGDDSLLEAANRVKPRLHIFGHVHECPGIISQNGIVFVNASMLNREYEPENIRTPIIIEL